LTNSQTGGKIVIMEDTQKLMEDIARAVSPLLKKHWATTGKFPVQVTIQVDSKDPEKVRFMVKAIFDK